jgi:hypothetical protein
MTKSNEVCLRPRTPLVPRLSRFGQAKFVRERLAYIVSQPPFPARKHTPWWISSRPKDLLIQEES